MSEVFTKWVLASHLRMPDHARLYLEASAEEEPGDCSMLRTALQDMAQGGNMGQLVRVARMGRKELCEALSANGNPTFGMAMRITPALGVKVPVTA